MDRLVVSSSCCKLQRADDGQLGAASSKAGHGVAATVALVESAATTASTASSSVISATSPAPTMITG